MKSEEITQGKVVDWCRTSSELHKQFVGIASEQEDGSHEILYLYNEGMENLIDYDTILGKNVEVIYENPKRENIIPTFDKRRFPKLNHPGIGVTVANLTHINLVN